jgi:hypothetical protein
MDAASAQSEKEVHDSIVPKAIQTRCQPFVVKCLLPELPESYSGAVGTRTRDQRIKSPLLYQLSYSP